jgi:hypothetical protein
MHAIGRPDAVQLFRPFSARTSTPIQLALAGMATAAATVIELGTRVQL